MKVLFILPDAYPEGSASAVHIQRQALGLRSNGVECEVLCFEKKVGQPELWRKDSWGIPYYGLHFTGSRLQKLARVPTLARFYATEVRKAIRERGVTHVWLKDGHWVLYRNLIRVCREEGIPIVAQLVEWWRFVSGPFRNDYYGQVLFHCLSLRKMSGLVGIAKPFVKLARANRLPVIILPVPCPPEEGAPDLSPAPSSIERGPFTFFYTGILQHRDMPEAMLGAMRILAAQKSDIRLVISGKNHIYRGGRAFVQAVAADPALKERVTFTGYLSNEVFRQQRAAADGYVLLHDDSWESRTCFPTRLSEFLCAGKPVIISGVGDIPLYLRDGKDAVLLPPKKQTEALAAAMIRLAGNREAAAQLGIAGRQRALEVFSGSKIGSQMKQFLLEATDKNAKTNRSKQPL